MVAITINRKELGKKGEQYAKLYLQRQQCQLIAQNWRCRSGEIDLIVLSEEQLVIVEVRTRTVSLHRDTKFGTAEESVDIRKQLKLKKLAQLFVMQNGYEHMNIRFDVITVYIQRNDGQYSIQHYKHAF